MKKLLCLTVIALTFIAPSAAFADDDDDFSGEEIVEAFCDQYAGSYFSKEEAAEEIRLYISELDSPTLEQLSALLDITEDMEDGDTLNEACD